MRSTSQKLRTHSRHSSSRVTPSASSRLQIAALAETFVADRLRLKGWTVVARNYRAVGTELDIVAAKGSIITIFEVKARRRLPQSVEEILPFKKRRALERGARRIISERGLPFGGICFDLVIVLMTSDSLISGMRYFPRVFEVRNL